MYICMCLCLIYFLVIDYALFSLKAYSLLCLRCSKLIVKFVYYNSKKYRNSVHTHIYNMHSWDDMLVRVCVRAHVEMISIFIYCIIAFTTAVAAAAVAVGADFAVASVIVICVCRLRSLNLLAVVVVAIVAILRTR